LRALNLKTGRAWAIKESLREFWRQPTREAALAALEALVSLGHALAPATGDQDRKDHSPPAA